MSTPLASMDAHIDDGILVTIVVENVGDRLQPSIGTARFALMTRDSLTWQLVTSRLLQEFASQDG